MKTSFHDKLVCIPLEVPLPSRANANNRVTCTHTHIKKHYTVCILQTSILSFDEHDWLISSVFVQVGTKALLHGHQSGEHNASLHFGAKKKKERKKSQIAVDCFSAVCSTEAMLDLCNHLMNAKIAA